QAGRLLPARVRGRRRGELRPQGSLGSRLVLLGGGHIPAHLRQRAASGRGGARTRNQLGGGGRGAMRFLVQVLLNGVALLVAGNIVPGIHWQGSVFYLFIAGLVFGIINLIVKPI